MEQTFYGGEAMKRVVWLVLVLAGCAHWTPADSAREAAYLALHVADWGQSLDIADHPERWHEHNPVLGSHPTRGDVNRYFAVTGVLHPVVSYALPRGWREVWQYSTIGLEMYCVGNNYSVGIGMGF